MLLTTMFSCAYSPAGAVLDAARDGILLVACELAHTAAPSTGQHKAAPDEDRGARHLRACPSAGLPRRPDRQHRRGSSPVPRKAGPPARADPACGVRSFAVVFVLLVEGVADALVGGAGLAVDAVGVDLEQDCDAVAGAAGDLGRGDPSVEP
jgi:hypothetical protein